MYDKKKKEEIIKNSHERSKVYGIEKERTFSKKILMGNEVSSALYKNKELIEVAFDFINILYDFLETSGFIIFLTDNEVVLNIVIEKLNPSLKSNFDPVRKSIPKFREMSNYERRELIARNPKYGKIICRCELITEGEILDSIKGPLGATTLDGVKRRTRAGMGRCQGGFCSSRIVDILSKELKVPVTMIKKNKGNSNILVAENKEGI